MQTRGSIAAVAAAAGTNSKKPSSVGTSPVLPPPTLAEDFGAGVQENPETMEATTTTTNTATISGSTTNNLVVHDVCTDGPQQEDDKGENSKSLVPEGIQQPSLPPKPKKRAAKDDQDAAIKPGSSKRQRKRRIEDGRTGGTLEQNRDPANVSPKKKANDWKHKFDLLCAFHRENGHTRVPKNFVVESVKLGLWVKEQRRLYRNFRENKKGACTPMNEERIAQLKSIGLEWNCNLATRTTRDDQWQRNLELLSAFQRENGHFRVPIDFVIDSIKLGQWVKNQRKYYKNRMAGKTGLRASITEERIAQLNAIGFRWNYNGAKEWRRDDDGWQKKFDLLCAFQREQRHCRVPSKFVVDSIKLGLWVENQKRYFKNYKKGKRGHGASITEERVSKLDSIGFEWK